MSYGHSNHVYHNGNYDDLSLFTYETKTPFFIPPFNNSHPIHTQNKYSELPGTQTQHNRCDYPPVEYVQPQHNPDLFVHPNSAAAQLGLTSEVMREDQEGWYREEY